MDGRAACLETTRCLCLYLLLSCTWCHASWTRECPVFCTCIDSRDTANQGVEVSCNGLNMTSLPQLPLETVTLDLSGNQIKKILARVFPHLSRLKSLWLDNNKISHLELFAFRGLHDLDVFSIRNNKLLEHLIRFSLAGLRNVRNLLLTDNSISYIQKNAFYGSSDIGTLALYGNPIHELRPGSFNNLRHLGNLGLPTGITAIIPGAFAGLSFVQELTLEGLNISVLQPETFFNLSDVTHLTIHDSVLERISLRAFAGMERVSSLIFRRCKLPEIGAHVFDGLGKMDRLSFERSHFSGIQRDFFKSLQRTAVAVNFNLNDMDCCALNQTFLREWKASTEMPHFNEFIHGISCLLPKWVSEESFFAVDPLFLQAACNGVLDQELKDELQRREKQKPTLSELYRARSMASRTTIIPWAVIFCLFSGSLQT